jgi:hypothetical protein
MRVCRKRGRVVEGTSLENWRRGNLFVSSNLTASARNCFQKVPSYVRTRVAPREYAGFLFQDMSGCALTAQLFRGMVRGIVHAPKTSCPKNAKISLFGVEPRMQQAQEIEKFQFVRVRKDTGGGKRGIHEWVRPFPFNNSTGSQSPYDSGSPQSRKSKTTLHAERLRLIHWSSRMLG